MPAPPATAIQPEKAPPPAPAFALPGPPVGLVPPPPPPPPCAPFEDYNGRLLVGDPLLDRLDSPPPGWFAAMELDFVKPHIRNNLANQVTINGFRPDLVQLPSAPLEWTVAPRFEIGYRFAQGFGEVLFGYRFLTTSSTASLINFDTDGPDGTLKTRLNVNSVNLDYSSREYSLGKYWDMKWLIGAQLGTAYFDSRATGTFLEQHVSNNFVGAGPHAGLSLWRCFCVPGLSLFGHIEGTALLGRIHQSFDEVVPSSAVSPAILTDPNLSQLSPNTAIGAATLDRGSQAIPILRLQTGLSWTPTLEKHFVRFALGYEFERWWFLGQLHDSSADLILNGFFVRAEYRY
jgi:hypothetical protein